MFALAALKSGGAILADEVGLGKTIEAGLIIKHLLMSGKNKILLIMPSNLRRQWQLELEEKFDIDALIVDSSNLEEYRVEISKKQKVIIVSYNFAAKQKKRLSIVPWDLCVFDEAHRMRNIHKNGMKMSTIIYELTKDIPKILLTATPMQNSLLDLYGLVQFIDEKIFYAKSVFSERYIKNELYDELKQQLDAVVQRTLRSEVTEYLLFPERKEITVDFELGPKEIELYMMINKYLQKEILYALPNSRRTLITSVIRKLLASSSMAVAETFEVLKKRLEVLKEFTREESIAESLDYFFAFLDDERRLAVVLEEDNDVVRYIKPPLNQMGLFYRAGKQYNPDFLVETKNDKFMIEVKAANQTFQEDVLEKARAGIKWCECATKVDADGKVWSYRMIPGDKIEIGNTFKYVSGLAVPIAPEN